MQGNSSSFDTMGSVYNYKYNQKELQETGFYDYGWRQYMPDLGRWFGMDQLSETYNSTSPYAYVMNNPAMMFDPDGRSTEMPDWMKTMWYMTPDKTNTSWSNTGTGSAFINTGFTGSMTPSYMGFYSPIGSTVGYSGTGTYAFGNSGGIGGNSGGYSSSTGEGYINIPTVYVSGNSSGWGKQAQAQFNAFMNVINENTEAFADWDRVNQGLGAFGFGNDVKTQLIEYGVTKSAGLTLREFRALNAATQQIRIIEALGDTGSKYFSVAKSLGTAVTIATTAYSTVKTIGYYKNGGTDWKVGVKYGLDLAMTGVGFLGPIGFGVSAAYFILDSATDGFNGFGEIPQN
ncbi:RHS repeat-associated core domain-containing protein [Epilithonimonas zeae]|uniref:RHS repeat-associated core domain-containing protein n=1 Tax=Epilithonimonas zeae TaxID=1416779 RepID=UPI00200C644F|nr:RHS repeat-associated core domain-containing protein [Epilithonimonas zeae]